MSRDAFNAGYSYPKNSVLLPDNKISTLLNIPGDVDASRDYMPAVIAGQEINANNLPAAAGVNPNRKTDQVTFVYQDDSFNRDANGVSQALPVNEPALVNEGGGLDEIVPIAGDTSMCRPNDVMLITGRTSTAVGVVTSIVGSGVRFASGDVLGINTPTSIDNPMRNITAPTSIRRVNLVTYKVSPDGTLVRSIHANDTAATVSNPSRDEPLVYGVEDLKIEYLTEDGDFTRNPTAGADGIAGTADDLQPNQRLVSQVRVTITVQSTIERRPDGQPFRITLSSTFDTRNLGYDAA
jgi:hypothetical protein